MWRQQTWIGNLLLKRNPSVQCSDGIEDPSVVSMSFPKNHSRVILCCLTSLFLLILMSTFCRPQTWEKNSLKGAKNRALNPLEWRFFFLCKFIWGKSDCSAEHSQVTGTVLNETSYLVLYLNLYIHEFLGSKKSFLNTHFRLPRMRLSMCFSVVLSWYCKERSVVVAWAQYESLWCGSQCLLSWECGLSSPTLAVSDLGIWSQ